MSKLFYLSEIIQFAIEKEKESFALYEGLASKATAPESKKLFHMLMQEEQKHEDFYTKMLSHVSEERSPGAPHDAEYQSYLQELIASSRKAVKPLEDVLTNTKDAIVYAIDRERDSIVFYIGLEHFVSSEEQAKVHAIAREEAKHMAMLINLKRNF